MIDTTKERLALARKRRARAPRVEHVNHEAADELRLYAENTGELYQPKLNIIRALTAKMAKGKYDPAKAPKLWAYWVEAAAKRYEKEIDPDVPWSRAFDAPTRRHVAAELAREYEARIRMELEHGRRDY